MSYSAETERFFERILGWPVGDGTWLASIGGDSCMILKDLGDVAGLLDVTGQLDCPRSVIDLEQIMGAPSDEDVQALVASASDETLVERRRRNFAADRDPPSFLSWTGWRLDLLASGLLSRAMDLTPWSRTAFPPVEVSLQREAALPMSSRSVPRSVRVSIIDGFEPVRDMLERAVFVTEIDVSSSDMGIHCRPDGTRVRI